MKKIKLNGKNKVAAIGIAAGAVILAAALIFAFTRGKSTSTEGGASVTKVSDVMNPGNDTGVVNRYAGVVEAQKTLNVAVNSEKTISETKVSEGDKVSVGDVLFSYDTSTDQDTLEKSKLELEKLTNSISNKQTEINQLNAEKAKVSSDEQLDYTIQIQSAEMELKETEYSKKSKEVEIQKLEESIANADVKATMAGTIKTINKESTDAYITIIGDGTYRIKGKINEQNVSSISSGQSVIVHSRVDEDKTWTGTLTELDTSQTASSSSDSYSSSDTSSTSSSYYFYVDLDDSTDLMLGQHVYIEMNYGQTEDKEGIWLDDGYIGYNDDGTAFIWASENGKLVKKTVELGSHDDNLYQYEIKSGLTEDDYIAYDDGTLEEGKTAYVNEGGDSSAD